MLLVVAGASFGLGWLSRGTLPAEVLEWRTLLVTAVSTAAVLLFAAWTLVPFLRWNSSWFFLTNRRLVQRTGLSRRSEREIPLVGIYELYTSQSMVQRWTGSGDLVLQMGHHRLAVLKDIPGIHRMRELTLDAIEALPRTAMFDGVDMLREQDGEWIGDGQQ
jgi:hypothetical protein